MALFGPKQKSPKACTKCQHSVQFGPYDDIATCGRCGEEFLTGYEEELRKIVEADCSKALDYPRYAAARAIGYASAIYGMATHGEDFDPAKIENHFRQQGSGAPTGGSGGDVELINSGSEGRGLRLRNLNDPRPGFLVILVTADRAARANGRDFQHIYIVFRGSRSDEGTKNPMLAGFTSDMKNVDYAANFTGRQDVPFWAAGGKVKIRRGFLELYRSMSIEITQELDRLLARHPRARVIVTGHSLGAALAVVCAHHLQYHRGTRIEGGGPFCLPFCTPRVGNIGFALDFKQRLGMAELNMPGEARPSSQFRRAMNFCMSNDPVSTAGEQGYKHDRSDDLRGPGTAAANRSFFGKAVYGMNKKTNKEIIFYQTPNLYRLGWFSPRNIHQYSKMQKIFLGRALYTT